MQVVSSAVLSCSRVHHKLSYVMAVLPFSHFPIALAPQAPRKSRKCRAAVRVVLARFRARHCVACAKRASRCVDQITKTKNARLCKIPESQIKIRCRQSSLVRSKWRCGRGNHYVVCVYWPKPGGEAESPTPDAWPVKPLTTLDGKFDAGGCWWLTYCPLCPYVSSSGGPCGW